MNEIYSNVCLLQWMEKFFMWWINSSIYFNRIELAYTEEKPELWKEIQNAFWLMYLHLFQCWFLLVFQLTRECAPLCAFIKQKNCLLLVIFCSPFALQHSEGKGKNVAPFFLCSLKRSTFYQIQEVFFTVISVINWCEGFNIIDRNTRKQQKFPRIFV